MGTLDGRIALVTGGGRGIGRGISELLAAHGATVAVNYRRDREAADTTVAAIEAAGGAARAYEASVDSAEGCGQLVDAITADLGAIDLLVCNAGIASRGRFVTETDPNEVLAVIGTHAIGPHHLCRLALPGMRERVATVGRGDVVMISSVGSRKPSPGGAPYMMAKAAMEALAFTLAKEEVRHGIHVNVVAPGLVETDMGVRLARAMTGRREMDDLRSLDAVSPFGRVCQPDDIAQAVLWLCSPGSGYVTGQRIAVDGGASG